jgi:acyl-CoA dehydrogenase
VSEFTNELTELIRSLAKDAEDPSGHPTSQWRTISELGLVTIGIAEDAGGSGGGLADLLLVIRELARAGIGTPIVEASTAAFAVGPPRHDAFDTIAVNRVVNLAAPTLTTRAVDVPFAPGADRLLLVGDSDVVVIPLAQEGVEIDVSTDIAGLAAGRVRLNGAEHQPVSNAPEASVIVERLALARSAALLGSAYGAYDLTRGYVTERKQFGAPLVEIPAISAALAQMTVRIRHAQSAVERAIEICTQANAPTLRRFSAVASARVATAGMATLVARTAHQLHGAVGVTHEYGLHRHTKKLWAWRDADEPERVWSGRLGAMALAVDENTLWNHVLA